MVNNTNMVADEHLIVDTARAAGVCALFATVRVLQTRYNFACPTFVTKTLKTLSSISPPISDDLCKRAHWTIFEEAVLIQFLFERKNKMISRTMFKDSLQTGSQSAQSFPWAGCKKDLNFMQVKMDESMYSLYFCACFACDPDLYD